MNFDNDRKIRKPDTFVLLMAAMSEKLVQKENECADMHETIQDGVEVVNDMVRSCEALREENRDLTADNRRLRDELSQLRTKVYGLESKAQDRDYYKGLYEKLYAEAQKRTLEDRKRELGIPLNSTPEETATAYMVVQGREFCQQTNPPIGGGKIGAIKVVRELTLWGLKESKDFVEAHMAAFEKSKVSDGETESGTKRSSQIPGGVGTNVRKSA